MSTNELLSELKYSIGDTATWGGWSTKATMEPQSRPCRVLLTCTLTTSVNPSSTFCNCGIMQSPLRVQHPSQAVRTVHAAHFHTGNALDFEFVGGQLRQDESVGVYLFAGITAPVFVLAFRYRKRERRDGGVLCATSENNDNEDVISGKHFFDQIVL